MDITTLILGALAIAVIILIFLQFRESSDDTSDLSVPLQNLTQTVNQSQKEIAVLSERVAALEPVTQNINSKLATDLAKVRDDISSLQSYAKARKEIEKQTSDSIRHLETIIAGTRSKGTAGENIVEQVFMKLPVEWQLKNFTINGKTVEFGLRMPSNLILPIDSKWPATDLIEKFAGTEDIEEQRRIKSAIEKEILKKAKEVSKYIDPDVTMPFGIAVIPDAAYELSAGVQTEAFQKNVVLVSYSNFVPYLFLVIQTSVKTLHSVDMQRLDSYLQSVLKNIEALQKELDGRFSRALTMLSNARDDMRSYISKAGGSIASLQISGASMDDTMALPGSVDE